MANDFNPPELTAAYCREAPTMLMFHPKSEQEAKVIADGLKGMGFNYYNEAYAGQLALAVPGCLYLDNDKTIMVSPIRRDDGLTCSIAGFGQFFMYADGVPGMRLTREELGSQSFAFYPRTFDEAFYALSALASVGIPSADAASTPASQSARGVLQGILVSDGRFSIGAGAGRLRHARVCPVADLGVDDCPRGVSAEQASLISAFNEVTARLTQLSERLEVVEHEVLPRTIEKSKPGLNHGG